jgi:hypothetical protein
METKHILPGVIIIPEELEAEIKDGKIIVRKKESEDEKNWKAVLEYVKDDALRVWLEKQKSPKDKGEISDGYHTFNELYYYRMLYNAAFFNLLPKEWVHKSKRHHDGEECFGGGWFIVMANLPTGQISNHYELKDWDLFQIPEKEVADEWDGHTPQEAAKRIHKYLLEIQKEQNPAEWSEDDEKQLNWFYRLLDFIGEEFPSTWGQNHKGGKEWLKALRPQPNNNLRWRRAKAGENLPESIIMPDGDDPRFGKCAVLDSYYIPVEELKNLPKDES